MSRSDLSSNLVHWTKGENFDIAFQSLISICLDGAIRSGNRGIADRSNCVCFTESPVDVFHQNIIGEFKPFGVEISKKWLFDLGGRPVIYQPRYDLAKLDPSIQWRHVDFSLSDNSYYRNYTWQREWRIKTDRLILPDEFKIAVPNFSYGMKLIKYLENYDYYIPTEEKIAEHTLYIYDPHNEIYYDIIILDELNI